MAEPFEEQPSETETTLLGQVTGDVKQTDVVGFSTAGGEAKVLNSRQTLSEALGGTIQPNDELEHDVKSYLSRWTRLDNFTFGAASFATLLFSVNIMDWLRTDERAAMFRQKLQGFYGMTATAEFMIQLNANPMEAGIIGMCFKPFYDLRRNYDIMTNKQYIGKNFVNYDALVQQSQYPGVWLNVASESSVTFSVPYIGPNVYINLLNPKSQWGRLEVYGVTNVNSASGKSDVDVNVYVSFKDVKLFGAVRGIAQGITPCERDEASGDHPFSGHAWLQGPSFQRNQYGSMEDLTGQNRVYQGEEEGIVTDIGKFAVPIVSALAPEASGFANTALALASAFGLSKPNAHPEVERMAITPFGQMQNTDGNSTAFKLSASTEQNTEIISLGLTDKDETSISYIAQQPSYLTQFSWSTADAVHDVLKLLPVNPNTDSAEDFVQADTTYARYQPTFLRFAAQQFKFWRGGIKFTFHIAATQFHSGRIRFIYSFGNRAPVLEHGTIPLYFSQVVDIRSASTFTLECPYMGTLPWKEVPVQGRAQDHAYLLTHSELVQGALISEETGWLYAIVETALRAPETVAQKVDIVVVVSGSEDFEVAVPQLGVCGAQTYFPPTPADLGVEQGPLIPDDAPMFTMTGATNAPNVSGELPSRHCVGERNLSFRALIKRYCYLGNLDLSPNVSAGGAVPAICPYFFRRLYISPTKFTTTDELLANILPAYAFYRGGMRFLLAPEGDGDIKVLYSPSSVLKLYNYAQLNVSAPFKQVYLSNAYSAFVRFRNNIQGGAEMQFPYYSQFPMMITGDPGADDTGFYSTQILNGEVAAGVAAISTKGKFEIYRSAADDFNLGYLVGCPMSILNIVPVRFDSTVAPSQVVVRPTVLDRSIPVSGGYLHKRDRPEISFKKSESRHPRQTMVFPKVPPHGGQVIYVSDSDNDEPSTISTNV